MQAVTNPIAAIHSEIRDEIEQIEPRLYALKAAQNKVYKLAHTWKKAHDQLEAPVDNWFTQHWDALSYYVLLTMFNGADGNTYAVCQLRDQDSNSMDQHRFEANIEDFETVEDAWRNCLQRAMSTIELLALQLQQG